MKDNTLIREAMLRCKLLLRNGYDAHVINAPLQHALIAHGLTSEVDIACSADMAALARIFPGIEALHSPTQLAVLREDNMVFHFFATDTEHAMHPELGQTRITPRLLGILGNLGVTSKYLTYTAGDDNVLSGFEDFAETGVIQLEGLPAQTLRRNYVLGIRALRLAANHNLPVEPNTWLDIVQAVSRILDYVPVKDIMDEWRQVSAVAMHRFVKLLYDAHILHRLIPEVAALACVQEPQSKNVPQLGSVFEHTIACMRCYPKGEWEHDWIGTIAALFHDIGKLYTGEFSDTWTFYQYHRVGAAVTRKILKRLHFPDDEADMVCNIVRNHLHFYFMLTDRGIRRFCALDDHHRIIALCRADIEARGGSTTNFNHNLKFLERAETDELLLEPLLNGNEIMEYTALPPGPQVGLIRENLLKAQIAGEVTDRAGALEFVKKYKE